MTNNIDPISTGVGAGTMAAAGTMAVLLHKKPKTITNLIHAYEGASSKSTPILEHAKNYLFYGKNVKHVPLRELAKTLKSNKGSTKVLLDADQSLIRKTLSGVHKHNVTYINKEYSNIDKIFQDKLHFGQLEHPSIIPTETLKHHTGNRHFATSKDLARHLASRKEDYYYKPRVDWGSGMEGHADTQEIREHLENNRLAPAIHTMWKHPERYIAQPRLDVGKGTEYRTHIHVENGHATPIGTSKRRWYYLPAKHTHQAAHKAAKTFNNIVKTNPQLAKRLAHSNMTLGADIFIPRTGRNLKIFELNDQSGYFDRLAAPHLVKKITGHTTPYAAAKKGLQAGTVTAAISAVGAETYDKTKQ